MDINYGRDQKVKNTLSSSFFENKAFLEEALKDCGDVVKNTFYTKNSKEEIFVLYVDGMADSQTTQDFVIRPLIKKEIPNDLSPEELCSYISEHILETVDWIPVNTYEEMLTEILSGNTLLLIQGSKGGLSISTKSFPSRGVGETTQEMVIRGPRDSFTENFRTNTALIRRRIRDPRLKMHHMQIGERSKTDIAIAYMDDLVQPTLLSCIKNKLQKISLDGIFDAGMLEQLLEKNHYSPFPQIQDTERPDKAASGLLEGRIILIVDNSPEVLLLPVTYAIFFQSGDDYYTRFLPASFARILRFLSALFAISFPALYIAAAGFHTEVLPSEFLFAIARSRNGIAIPIVIEVLLMEFQFELLKEASIHLPGQLGGTIGIVGGLIVGQAAVEAGLVSTIVVIVVAFTAIASFAIPNESFASAFRLLRFLFIIISAIWGIYGFALAFAALLFHLATLESFGIPYMFPSVCPDKQRSLGQPDHYTRYPYRYLFSRPVFTRRGRKIRMNKEDNHDI